MQGASGEVLSCHQLQQPSIRVREKKTGSTLLASPAVSVIKGPAQGRSGMAGPGPPAAGTPACGLAAHHSAPGSQTAASADGPVLLWWPHFRPGPPLPAAHGRPGWPRPATGQDEIREADGEAMDG